MAENQGKIKRCSTCKQDKTLDCFYRQKDKKDGLRYSCKECANVKTNQKRNTPEYKEYLKTYYQSDSYKKRIKERNKTEKYKEYLLEYKQTDKWKEYEKRYKKENLQRALEIKKKRYNTDTQFRLSQLLRNRTRQAIKQRHKSGSAIADLGCTLADLMRHLELQFDNKMNWENMGEWHIDHIKPLAVFNLEERNEYLKAVHYTNLQPMWEIDNKRKGAKV